MRIVLQLATYTCYLVPEVDKVASILDLDLILCLFGQDVSGTSKQHAADHYTKRLLIGYTEAEEVVGRSLSCLAESKSKFGCTNTTNNFQRCLLLNITYCPPSEVDLSSGKSLVVVVYNSLGWKRNDVIRIPVIDENVIVKDSGGSQIESQILPLLNASIGIRNYYNKAYLGSSPKVTSKFWLEFPVFIPPLGFKTYIISRSTTTTKQAGQDICAAIL